MSKSYKINVIAHQLKGKKIAKHGEIVSESELTSDAGKLVKAGFIVEVSAKEQNALLKAAADAAKAAADKAAADAAKAAAEKLKNKIKQD